jgi:hypothetical protein
MDRRSRRLLPLFWGCGVAFLASCTPSAQGSLGAPTQREMSTGVQVQGLPRSGRDRSKGALLYVSSDSAGQVYVFSYPRLRLVGTVSGFISPEGLCSDAVGHVFVTDAIAQQVVEFSHGGTAPIATLSDAGYNPFDCSIDPVSGNLAVTNQRPAGSSGPGNIAVYSGAQGEPTYFGDPMIYRCWACGYDDDGDLFVDGISGDSNFAELPKGSSTFTNLSLSFETPGGIKWDGKYLAVGSIHGESHGSVIYRLSISGSTVKTIDSVPIDRGKHKVMLRFFDVYNSNVNATFNNHIGTWKYPVGGSPTKSVRNYIGASGIALSLAP